MDVMVNGRPARIATTDERFVFVVDCWWDTKGTDLVEQGVVNRYLDENPQVGVMLILEQ